VAAQAMMASPEKPSGHACTRHTGLWCCEMLQAHAGAKQCSAWHLSTVQLAAKAMHDSCRAGQFQRAKRA
jgi:hypothetical protein